VESVRVLIQGKADVNILNYSKVTPLQTAERFGHEGILNLMQTLSPPEEEVHSGHEGNLNSMQPRSPRDAEPFVPIGIVALGFLFKKVLDLGRGAIFGEAIEASAE